MEYKKGMSEITTTVILVILVLVAIGIVWGVISSLVNQSQPEFKITVEECVSYQTQKVSWNINNYYASKVLGLNEYNLHSLLNGEEDIICDEHICTITASYFYETCEQIEVGEIEYAPYSDCTTNENYFSKEEINHTWISSKNETHYCIIEYNKKLKEDLTIEWLEENCGCLDFQGNPTKSYNSCKTHSADNEALKREGKCCAELKYKCDEDFIIEVIK